MQPTVGFYKPVLVRTAIVVLPAAALLGVGRLTLSAWYFYVALILVLLHDIVRHKHLECVATAIACSPERIASNLARW